MLLRSETKNATPIFLKDELQCCSSLTQFWLFIYGSINFTFMVLAGGIKRNENLLHTPSVAHILLSAYNL